METLLALTYFLFGKAVGNSKVWNNLALLYIGMGLSSQVFGTASTDSFHYILRAILTFYIATRLMQINNSLSRYQLIWVISSLVLYLCLHIDLLRGTDVVYTNYEGICYGIIFFQLLGVSHGILHRAWCGFLNRLSTSSPIVQFDKVDARKRCGSSNGSGRIDTDSRNDRRGNGQRHA